MADSHPQILPYATVPLRDRADSGGRSESGRNTPYSSGTNTPNGSHNKKKGWGIFPMNSNTNLEAGQMGEKLKRPKHPRNGSWDLLGYNADWEGYNPANAKNENLRFAEGDVGTNKVGTRCRVCRVRRSLRLAPGFEVVLLVDQSEHHHPMDHVHCPRPRYPLDPRYTRSHCFPRCHNLARQAGELEGE